MIIHYLDVIGVPVFPPKAYSPSIVDSDAMLLFPISSEGFESIGERGAEIVEIF